MPHTFLTPPRMRSWLLARGDSEKKMGKAEGGNADIVLLDLEDPVSPENKPAARQMVAGQIAASANKARLWVRINPVAGHDCIADLAAIMPARPGRMLAIHHAQVDPINEAFTPSPEELAHARAMGQAFADHPGAGVVALDGAMLARPHLVLAQRLLAEAGAQ